MGVACRPLAEDFVLTEARSLPIQMFPYQWTLRQ